MKRVKETKKKSCSLTIRLPEQLFSKLQEVAEETDTSMAYHMRRALEIYFDESYVDAEEARLYEESSEAEYISEDELKKELGIKKPSRSKGSIAKHTEVKFGDLDAIMTGEILRAIKSVTRRYLISSLEEDEESGILEADTEESKEAHQEAAR